MKGKLCLRGKILLTIAGVLVVVGVGIFLWGCQSPLFSPPTTNGPVLDNPNPPHEPTTPANPTWEGIVTVASKEVAGSNYVIVTTEGAFLTSPGTYDAMDIGKSYYCTGEITAAGDTITTATPQEITGANNIFSFA